MSKQDEKTKAEPKPEEAIETNKSTEDKAAAPKQEEDVKPFDFGGLPDRDLKKNLGCG